MTGFVLDASVVLAWLLAEPAESAERMQRAMLAGARVAVPAHWSLEIANGLIMARRRRRLQGDLAETFTLLESLRRRVEVEEAPSAVDSLVAFAVECGLTAYDASYVWLAQRRGLALATEDKAMMAAAKQLRIALF